MKKKTILHDAAACDLCRQGWKHSPIGDFPQAHRRSAESVDIRAFARWLVKQRRLKQRARLN